MVGKYAQAVYYSWPLWFCILIGQATLDVLIIEFLYFLLKTKRRSPENFTLISPNRTPILILWLFKNILHSPIFRGVYFKELFNFMISQKIEVHILLGTIKHHLSRTLEMLKVFNIHSQNNNIKTVIPSKNRFSPPSLLPTSPPELPISCIIDRKDLPNLKINELNENTKGLHASQRINIFLITAYKEWQITENYQL